jgi:dTDP-L-rhamnose 4-epimerase
MKKILITGGAGFIGSHLALALISKGYSVRVVDNLSRQIHGDEPENSILYQSIKGNIDFILGDVRDSTVWAKALTGIDVVVHLAAETGTGQSMYKIHRYTDVNMGGTAGLLDYMANEKHSINKVIVASS